MEHNSGMDERRVNTRYPTIAKVRIADADSGEILLKDISVTGCCVECATPVEVELNMQYILKVIPESDTKIGDFDLLVLSKWVRDGSYSHEIGFNIIESPKGKQFQRYVDYLSLLHS